MKILIGLTGKTGSGKTSASEMFERMGAFVVDCDAVAHEILNDDIVKENLVEKFSPSVLDGNNNIDRKILGNIVFSDTEKLEMLNSIVHKVIVDKSIDMCINSGCDICIIDGSELEASGADKKCAHIVVIESDEDTRLNRIIARDNIDREKALLRIRAQKDYTKSAIHIENSSSRDILKEKIADLYNKFLGEINA